MKKPVLVVMAAGMGSRYGGLKQIDPVGPNGEVIIDYSLYDARRAGFEKVVFVIKKEIEADFKEIIGGRAAKYLQVEYAYQQLDDLPGGYAVPEGRVKPWGTAHAVLAARALVDGPFAVINADDYYGREAFEKIYEYLLTHPDGEKYAYAMVGYHLRNTLTENGHVARGVCEVSDRGMLERVTERTKIFKDGADAKYTEDEGATWQPLPGDATVSMNMWGFTASFLKEAGQRFPAFLDGALAGDPQKAEYFLPSVVSALIGEGRAEVKVLTSRDKWYGVTYKEDKPVVVAAVRAMIDAGVYPTRLWGSGT
ncbi:nucleotidyltransferase [Anaerofilum sp. BX8]|uniref:Nucleotidyltransferase n=1 Tax=Anaerofilum hominis TaxID=2763016 RepID=A0A923L166_9FIRM|nr:sugar phosphate nucleotidyltransferase [Anaerofilum hominis]MBC5581467.1 nucleotidyltransferase [Anaerofilum hominis]